MMRDHFLHFLCQKEWSQVSGIHRTVEPFQYEGSKMGTILPETGDIRGNQLWQFSISMSTDINQVCSVGFCTMRLKMQQCVLSTGQV